MSTVDRGGGDRTLHVIKKKVVFGDAGRTQEKRSLPNPCLRSYGCSKSGWLQVSLAIVVLEDIWTLENASSKLQQILRNYPRIFSLHKFHR